MEIVPQVDFLADQLVANQSELYITITYQIGEKMAEGDITKVVEYE